MKFFLFILLSTSAMATIRPEYCPDKFQFSGAPGSEKIAITFEGKKTLLNPEGDYTFQRSPAGVQIFDNYSASESRSDLPRFELTHADGKEASLKYDTEEEHGLCVLKLQ